MNIVVHLRGGPLSALPWRHYGWNMCESPGKLYTSEGRNPDRIEGPKPDGAVAD